MCTCTLAMTWCGLVVSGMVVCPGMREAVCSGMVACFGNCVCGGVGDRLLLLCAGGGGSMGVVLGALEEFGR